MILCRLIEFPPLKCGRVIDFSDFPDKTSGIHPSGLFIHPAAGFWEKIRHRGTLQTNAEE
jgi:hypothetical protein